MNATALSLIPGFVEWYKTAKDIVAEQFAKLSETELHNAEIETIEDFALEVYSACKGLTPAEPVVS